MLRASLVSLTIWVLPQPAAAHPYRVVLDSNDLAWIVIGTLAIGWLIAWASAKKKREQDGLPVELNADDTAEDYDAQATRLRALKRKLDAEVELTESYINAEQARCKLDEVAEILRHDRARRSAGGRQARMP